MGHGPFWPRSIQALRGDSGWHQEALWPPVLYSPPREGMILGLWIVHLLGFARFCITSLCYSSSLAPSGDSQALFWGCCRPLVVGMPFVSFCLNFCCPRLQDGFFQGGDAPSLCFLFLPKWGQMGVPIQAQLWGLQVELVLCRGPLLIKGHPTRMTNQHQG